MLWCEGLYGLSYYGNFGPPNILVTGPKTSVDLGQILLKMLVLAFACACTHLIVSNGGVI